MKLTQAFLFIKKIHPNPLKTLWVHIFTKGKRSLTKIFLICNKTRISIHSSAELNIYQGHFIYNCGWVSRFPIPSVFIMRKNARLNIYDTVYILMQIQK